MEDIERVKRTINYALADGRLSPQESELIKRAIYRDKKVTKEEAVLWRELQTKIVEGEVYLD